MSAQPKQPRATSQTVADAERLWQQAAQLLAQQKLPDAAKLMREALTILQRELPAADQKLAMARWALAQTDAQLREYGEAARLVAELLKQSESEGDASAARSTELRAMLADLQFGGFELEAANQTRQRVIKDLEAMQGPLSQAVLINQIKLAGQYQTAGDLDAAEQLLRGCIDAVQRARGVSGELVMLQNELMQLLERRGDLEAAERMARANLELTEQRSPNNPALSTLHVNLGGMLMRGDKLQEAAVEFEKAVALREALGPEHPSLADALMHLAFVQSRQGHVDKAEAAAQRALSIRQHAFGPSHPVVAKTLDQLGTLALRGKNDPVAAEKYFTQAVALGTQLDDQNARLVPWLQNLANAQEARRDFAAAERNRSRALTLARKALGEEHTGVAELLNGLSRVYAASGQAELAMTTHQQAGELAERLIRRALGSGNEQQKRNLMAQGWVGRGTDEALSFHLRSASQDPRAAELALTTVLRRKGRALDATSDLLKKLRQQATTADRAKLARLSAARTALAELTFRDQTVDSREQQGRYQAEADELSRELGNRYRALTLDQQPITLERVRKALPVDGALIELVVHQPVEDKSGRVAQQEPEYVAYVVAPQGDVAWARLGSTRSLDALVTDARRRLAGRDPGAGQALRRLDEKLMRPLRKLLGSARDLYVAPDGALNLLPFSALVDEDGGYLVKRFRFTYLSSGRDLLREAQAVESRSEAAVYAAPAYGDSSGLSASKGRLGAVTFTPLPGTLQEGNDVAALLGKAALYTGEAASEQSLKALSAPRVLHIATHGFFVDAARAATPTDSRGLQLQLLGDEAAPSGSKALDDAMLRAGLALSGANRARAGGADGILTALELADLDLSGTKLVVLSACDTGLGAAKSGDSVYGLRRALVLSGSETQLTSLWKVDDDATRSLMTQYYRRLASHDGRSNALREVSLSLLAQKATEHPYYWAPFIVSGNQRSLDGAAPPPVRVVEPAASSEH